VTLDAAERPGSDLRTASVSDCTFQTDPEEFLSRQSRVRREIYDRAVKVGGRLARAAEPLPAAAIPIRNFIDAEILGGLAARNVLPAPLSTDEEFFRRVSLDLTGRIPSAEEVRAFTADASQDKRDRVIDRLLNSPEFVDRWTLWLGDLLQNNAQATNFSRQINGRNAFHNFIRSAVAANQPLRDIAWLAVAASGNNFDNDTGAANFAAAATTPMGPAQDTYDSGLARAATAFLGLAHYDCLLCHDGRGHLTQISAWGTASTRLQAQRMAAFFSRTRLARNPAPRGEFYYQSVTVMDAPAGSYLLNTNFGNRPFRTPAGTIRELTPVYHATGATPADGNWRAAFADNMVKDPMFARNLANRIWKHFFNLGLVDPVDTLDPARLDPANPPPEPWTLQATHPALLERLAGFLGDSWFNLREFCRLVAQSSAYQLSSRYEGPWTLEYVPLFARHYPRRLEGEEVHDAITKATGVPGNYMITGWTEPARWAVQLPEPVEPRSNGAVAAFMNAFLRGNRDTQVRSQAASILQQLNVMNDPFVLNRIRLNSSPILQAIARMPDDQLADELFLTFLSRKPSADERALAVAYVRGAGSGAARNTAVEDLAWVAVNKLEFLFSY
jgi:hypothetical protein